MVDTVDLHDAIEGEFQRWWNDGPTKAGYPLAIKDVCRLAFLGGVEAREALVIKGRVLGLKELEI
jgi:hypothetical protein